MSRLDPVAKLLANIAQRIEFIEARAAQVEFDLKNLRGDIERWSNDLESDQAARQKKAGVA